MGEVISFKPGDAPRKRVLIVDGWGRPIQQFPPITPWPSWKYALRDRYWSRDKWKTPQKGNSYVVVDGRCITWFRQRDGWSWSISVVGSDDEPLRPHGPAR
jgi:hypothetical protein